MSDKQLPAPFAYYCPKNGRFMNRIDYLLGAYLAGPRRGNYEPIIFQSEAAAALAAQAEEVARLTAERDALRTTIHAELLATLEEPDDELLNVFQAAFVQQLHRRRHKPHLESAEKAGIRAMLKHAIDAARTGSKP